jgi:hypothetical protein
MGVRRRPGLNRVRGHRVVMRMRGVVSVKGRVETYVGASPM